MTTEELAKQNDLFRTTMFRNLGRVVLTDTLNGSKYAQEAISQTREFSNFTGDNDPHGEHDFGAFNIDHKKFFWKIDYYDTDFQYGADPKTEPHRKVLTIMFAEDY